MRIQKKEFLRALNIATMGVASSSAVNEMLNYNFYKENLLTYNGSLLLSIPMKLNKCEFSVSAKKFLSAVSSMPENFELIESENLIVLKGESKKVKTNFGLAEMSDENITHDLFENIQKGLANSEFKKLPSNFLEGIRLCMFSTAKSSNFGTLACLNIKNDYMLSSDNLRISAFTLDGEMPEILLPVENCKTLLKLKPISYVYHEDDNIINFLTESGVVISVRIVKGNYPDYKKIATQEYSEYEDLILPDEFSKMINDVGIVNQEVSETEQYVKLTINKEAIIVETEHASGWAYKELKLDEPLNRDISDFSTTLLLQSLLEITKTINTLRVITQKEKENRVLFVSDKFRHILPTIQTKKKD